MNTPLMEQIKGVYKNEKLWFYVSFTFNIRIIRRIYSILTKLLVSHFGLEKVDAGMRTAGFIVLATIMRPIGGWLGDKFNPFKILIFVFIGLTLSGIILSFMPSMNVYTFGCLLVAFCAGIGNGTIFKLVPMYFSEQAGIVNGLVSALGGLGGFFPPLILTLLFQLTGHYAIGFMALSEVALACLIITVWMYSQEKLLVMLKIINKEKNHPKVFWDGSLVIGFNMFLLISQ